MFVVFDVLTIHHYYCLRVNFVSLSLAFPDSLLKWKCILRKLISQGQAGLTHTRSALSFPDSFPQAESPEPHKTPVKEVFSA